MRRRRLNSSGHAEQSASLRGGVIITVNIAEAATKFADWCMFNEARVHAWSKLMVDAIRDGERDAHARALRGRQNKP